MILRTSASIRPMTLRIAAFAALALLSSACTYRSQSAIHQLPPDNTEAAYYDQPFGASPTYASLSGQGASSDADAAPLRDRPSATPPARTNDLGFTVGHTPEGAEIATVDAESVETVEVEAEPGSACYDAAVKAGISKGVCTLVVERKYLLVGEKAR